VVGHSTYQTTADIYWYVTEALGRDASERLPDALFGTASGT